MTWQDWKWDESLFAGAAPFYDRGRLPYAPGLADAMARALRLDRSGRLLDVGCGPGTVTLAVAHLFDAVVGLDADPGMLAEAARLAEERGVPNATWVHRRAEELPGGLGSFRVITFAASFHWMDRPRVASAVASMLDAGGAVIHVDNGHQNGTDPRRPAPHPSIPHAAIGDLRELFLGADKRAGQSVRNTSPDDEDDVFRAAGLTGPDVVVVADGRILHRSVEDVVALVLSSSSTAPHLFGERAGQFVHELSDMLTLASSSGLFSVHLPDNALKIWRRAH